MTDLPNLREALVTVSEFAAFLCLFVVGFTTWSRRVQSNEYNFSYGQFLGVVGLIIFGIIFTFGYSLPRPVTPETPKTLAQVRAEHFEKLYRSCLPSDATPTNRTDCAITARQQADIALGLTPMLIKVVTRDPAITTGTRSDKYSTFDTNCRDNIANGNRPDAKQLAYCAELADRQTDAALGIKRTSVSTPAPQIKYVERPNSYTEAYKLCMGNYAVDGEPNPVELRNDRIKLCHSQAMDVVSHHL